MSVTAKRILGPIVGHLGNNKTLEQQFRLDGINPKRLAELIWTSPLLGEGSLMGKKSGTVDTSDETQRVMRGFSPAPSISFDVTIRKGAEDNTLLVQFSQPGRSRPYLQGGLLWRALPVEGEPTAAIFDEQINTKLALEHQPDPLGGPSASFRRFIFYKVGHGMVMAGMIKNIAQIANAQGD